MACCRRYRRKDRHGKQAPSSGRKGLLRYEVVASEDDADDSSQDRDDRVERLELGDDDNFGRSDSTPIVHAEAVLSTDGLLDAEEQSGDFGNWLEQDKPQGKIKRDYSSYD